MAVNRTGGLPAEANFIDLRGSDFREVETSLNGQPGETGIVLDARDAFFRRREKEFAVAHDACRGIVHLRVVDSDGQHEFSRTFKLNIKLAGTRICTALIPDVQVIGIATI